MALSDTGITTTIVRNCIGVASNLVSVLVGATGLNRFSFYAPGQLVISGSNPDKVLVLTPVTTNYKLGDFRRYDSSILASHAPSGAGIITYPPSGATTASFTEVWHPEKLNIKAVTGYDNYVTMNFYKTATDRTNLTNLWHTQIFAISYQAVTGGVLTGHTRNQTQEPVPHQNCSIAAFPLATLTTPDHLIKGECFISNSSGGRVLNLGVTRTDGYFDVNLHKFSEPYISGTGSVSQEILLISGVVNPPTTLFVHLFTRCYSASTPVGSFADTAQVGGTTGYDIYVKAIGAAVGGGTKICAIQSCNIRLTIKDAAGTTRLNPVIATGVALGITSGTILHLNSTLPIGAWAYDDIATITLESVVFATTPATASC
jgi:hypothetical protein